MRSYAIFVAAILALGVGASGIHAADLTDPQSAHISDTAGFFDIAAA
jgi:predicted outer membrane protein